VVIVIQTAPRGSVPAIDDWRIRVPSAHNLREAGLLLLAAALVAAATAIALISGVEVWIAAPVGLVAYIGLYMLARAWLRPPGSDTRP
jgi:hypothetical protein